MAAATFRDWLGGELQKQNLTRRALARKLAEKHPEGVNPSTVESARRQIYKYLDPAGPTIPSESTRIAFADALGVKASEIPDDDEEDEPVSREAADLLDQLDTDALLAVLAAALKSKSRRKKGVKQ